MSLTKTGDKQWEDSSQHAAVSDTAVRPCMLSESHGEQLTFLPPSSFRSSPAIKLLPITQVGLVWIKPYWPHRRERSGGVGGGQAGVVGWRYGGHSGFSILPKDTSACRWVRLGIELPTFRLDDDHSTPQPQLPLQLSFSVK
ncbi:unnamed protein product [Pleuronectes platessa]|uniref:Uncharacterized protein n=1 Tax=Pleuronectes platessa TaxID=8262 RepID=A0A9N7UIU7_PLEPL|nr:unnamed protein product [Pleuronectes platessa]